MLHWLNSCQILCCLKKQTMGLTKNLESESMYSSRCMMKACGLFRQKWMNDESAKSYWCNGIWPYSSNDLEEWERERVAIGYLPSSEEYVRRWEEIRMHHSDSEMIVHTLDKSIGTDELFQHSQFYTKLQKVVLKRIIWKSSYRSERRFLIHFKENSTKHKKHAQELH